MVGKIRIGALISGGGTNLQAIIEGCEADRIDGELVFVGSDTPKAQGLARAEKHGIPTFVVDYNAVFQRAKRQPLDDLIPPDFDLDKVLALQHLITNTADKEETARYFQTRAAAEAGLLREMGSSPFDLLVLAGFMRVLTPYFIDQVNKDPSLPRIMNIHPALLPSFPGVDGYGETYAYGCKVAGCTVHFVDYGEDTGAIIGQRSFQIEPEDTVEKVREKGLGHEWELYPACIQLFAQNRLKVVVRTSTLKSGVVLHRKVVEVLPEAP